jgi:hypothetical protein
MKRSPLELLEGLKEDLDKGSDVDGCLLRSVDGLAVMGVGEADCKGWERQVDSSIVGYHEGKRKGEVGQMQRGKEKDVAEERVLRLTSNGLTETADRTELAWPVRGK